MLLTSKKGVTTVAPYRLQIYLDPAMRDALRLAALQEHTTLQALVTQWLQERLERYEGEAQATGKTRVQALRRPAG